MGSWNGNTRGMGRLCALALSMQRADASTPQPTTGMPPALPAISFLNFFIRDYDEAYFFYQRYSDVPGWFSYTAPLNVPTYQRDSVLAFSSAASSGAFGRFGQQFSNEDGNQSAEAAFHTNQHISILIKH